MKVDNPFDISQTNAKPPGGGLLAGRTAIKPVEDFILFF